MTAGFAASAPELAPPSRWERALGPPRSVSSPIDRTNGRLVSGMALACAFLNIFSAVQAFINAPPPVGGVVASTLLPAAVLYMAAYTLVRFGAYRVGAATLLATMAVIPYVITVRNHLYDDGSVVSLGAWSILTLLVGSAFVSFQWTLITGGLSVLALLVTLVGAGGVHGGRLGEAVVFVITATAVIAVASRHREKLERIRKHDLEDKNRQLTELRDTLETQVTERTRALLTTEKMAVIGRLTAGVAHEMSSPLAALLAALDDLGALSGEYREAIGDPAVNADDHRQIAHEMETAVGLARTAAQRAATFVRSIRAQTRSNPSSRRERFDALALVRDSVNLLAHAARAGRTKVAVTSSSPMIELSGSPDRFAQVVTNLVGNALDATGERGGGGVQVEVSGEPGKLRIVVKDDGPGIPPEVLPHIFEPLFTTKPIGRGTGLGLSIVKEIVEADYGGTITVETTVGTGTTFELELADREAGSHGT
jgi:signal transduction histidine kinase